MGEWTYGSLSYWSLASKSSRDCLHIWRSSCFFGEPSCSAGFRTMAHATKCGDRRTVRLGSAGSHPMRPQHLTGQPTRHGFAAYEEKRDGSHQSDPQPRAAGKYRHPGSRFCRVPARTAARIHRSGWRGLSRGAALLSDRAAQARELELPHRFGAIESTPLLRPPSPQSCSGRRRPDGFQFAIKGSRTA